MFRLICLFAAALSLSGCFTLRQDEVDQEARQRALRESEQRRMIEEYQQRTQMSLQDSEAQLAMIQKEVRSMREELARAQAQDIQHLDQRITRLEASIRELEQRRQKDREEIIDILSKRMAEVMSRQQPRAPANTGGAGQTHQVAAGETLGAIATAYGVSAQAIIQANNISNPNTLRVGQRLVIPR